MVWERQRKAVRRAITKRPGYSDVKEDLAMLSGGTFRKILPFSPVLDHILQPVFLNFVSDLAQRDSQVLGRAGLYPAIAFESMDQTAFLHVLQGVPLIL